MKEKNECRMGSRDQLGTFLLSFWFIACFRANYADLENPRVTIIQGTLEGVTMKTRHDRNISAFLGIPYAQPPTGNLRFANPVAANGWDGILNANASGNSCPQLSLGSSLTSGEENCLYINVYTSHLPKTANSSLLPVMVYIHGGAFRVGSSSPTVRGPEYLMDEDIVFVAANYRLGLLGFLSTGDDAAAGNWALKDQVLALEWVRDNVEYFGGDPSRVTLFGESAGAVCVHLLSMSNVTSGLFHRYITQSGSALAQWAHRPRVAYSSRAFELGKYVGCVNATSDSLIDCLRTVEASVLMSADQNFLVWHTIPDIIWGPTDEPDIEGAILTDSPANLFAAGKIRDIPWISGVDRDEGLLQTGAFYKDEKMLRHFLENIDTLMPLMLGWMYQSDSGTRWLNATKSYYFNNDLTTNKNEILKNLTILASDTHFFYPVINALRQHHALAKSPQYFYMFSYRGTFSLSQYYAGTVLDFGVSHSDELIYLFPRKFSSSAFNDTMSEADDRMVDILVQLWTSFAINGTPSTLDLDGGATWEPYSTEDNFLRIGNESDVALELENSFCKDRMEFWTALDVNAMEDSGESL